MTPALRLDRASLHWIGYGVLLAVIVALWVLYALNLARWPDSPDFGWRTMYTSGPNVVSQVFGQGQAAGLRPGDRIVAVNGRAYSTFDELFFGSIRREAPGSVNTYTVAREGTTLEIPVPTGRVGFSAVATRSGPLFAVGVLYLLIGALVFLMKPKAEESWVFFCMTCFLGIGIGLSSPADLMRPSWLYDLRFLANVLIPASIIHLALKFPKPRGFRTGQAVGHGASLSALARDFRSAADDRQRALERPQADLPALDRLSRDRASCFSSARWPGMRCAMLR